MLDPNELGAVNSGGQAVCSERLDLLLAWTQALTAMVQVTTQLAQVTHYASDFVRHEELLKKASLLHEEALAAKNAFYDHCAQHGCIGKIEPSTGT